MKTMLNKFLYVGMLCTIAGCTKDKLTKATQKGANMFSCKVNGAIFKPYDVGGLFNDFPVLSVRNNIEDGFSVDAQNQETYEDVSIESSYLTTAGVYKLQADHLNRGIYNYRIIVNMNDAGVYITDSTDTGALTITRCDNINNIYSGTFYFTAKDPDTGKTVSVTDGRFDVKE